MHFEMPVPFTRSNRFDFAQVLSSGWVSVGNKSNYSPFFHETEYLTVKGTRVNIVKACQIMSRSLCLSCFRAICLANLETASRSGRLPRALWSHPAVGWATLRGDLCGSRESSRVALGTGSGGVLPGWLGRSFRNFGWMLGGISLHSRLWFYMRICIDN